jgi:ribosomal protein S18 acetylase RimI-like enzyme
MITIKVATSRDAQVLSQIGRETFLDVHKTSAPLEDLHEYADHRYDTNTVESELTDTRNTFSIIYYKGQVAGYSKLIFDSQNDDIQLKNVTQLDRFYLIKEFYGRGLGKALIDSNLKISRAKDQTGIWLCVWSENIAAINFYKAHKFEVIKKSLFKITERHFNPCLYMHLPY